MALFGRNDSKRDKEELPELPTPSLTAPLHKPAPAPVVVAEAPKKETPTLSPDGTLDFNAIYAFANLPAAPFTAEQTLAMLEQLPDAMPLEMKRQTVQVTLGAMGTAIGASRSSIVSDATKKRESLTHYADAQGKKTADYVATEEAEIAELQRKIAEKESLIADAKSKQARVKELCDGESSRLDSVLGFFSESTSAPVLTLHTTAPVAEPEADEEDSPEVTIITDFKLAA